MSESLELALEHARRAGDELEQAQILVWLGTSYCFGPTPVRDAIKRCEELRASGGGLAWVESATLGMLAFLEGMHGNFQEARDLYGRSKRIIEELGMRFALAGRAIIPAAIESFAGDPEAAERELRWGYDLLEEMGERELRSTIAAYLAQVLIEQGRDDLLLEHLDPLFEQNVHKNVDDQLVDHDGTGETRLTNTPSVDESYPAWQPVPQSYVRPAGASPRRPRATRSSSSKCSRSSPKMGEPRKM